VQDGWIGHVLPFDIVQELFLADDVKAFQTLKDGMASKESELQEIMDNLTEDDFEGDVFKRDDDGEVSVDTKELGKAYKDAKKQTVPDDQEKTIIAVKDLTDKIKELKGKIKDAESLLADKTKTTIESGLTDGQVKEVLRHKWILDLIEYLQSMPQTVVQNYSQKITGIVNRYVQPLIQIEKEETETAQELCALFADLTTEDKEDAQAIEAIRQLLTSK
jgi:type I restriction enzyme M protein